MSNSMLDHRSGKHAEPRSSQAKHATAALPGEAQSEPALLDHFDKAVIVGMIAVFLVLFVWLFGKQPPIYAYMTFIAILTLIFVGFLRATGVLRTSWIALGGSVAVYAGLFLLLDKAFERDTTLLKDIASLQEQLRVLRLKESDPAMYALQGFYGSLQQKGVNGLRAAYETISDAQKAQWKRTLPPDADEFKAWASTFENTDSYYNVTYLLVREESDSQRVYRVSYDVVDRVPHNRLFENRTKAISSIEGFFDKGALTRTIIDNLNEYYVVTEAAVPAILEYVRARSLEDLLDPTFIGELIIGLRNTKGIELQDVPTPPNKENVSRYFRHDNVVMIKQGDGEWKIRSFGDTLIALYK